MQTDTKWKAAANLVLLLGTEHPPVRLERPPVVGLPYAQPEVLLDARSTADFRGTAYCGRQDVASTHIRANLIRYYRNLLEKIPLWQHTLEGNKVDGEAVKDEPDVNFIKKEVHSDADGEVAVADAEAQVVSEMASSTYHAIGILTQVNDPTAIGEKLLVPWEFYVIADLEDETAYVAAFNAMSKEVSMERYPFFNLTTSGSTVDGNYPTRASKASSFRELEATDHAGSTNRLSLYTRLLPQFTGVYPGMAVGIVGEPFQRNATGVLTGVLVRQLLLPSRPLLPWNIGDLLPTGETARRSLRVHFCSGPFPRRDINSLLGAVVRQALHRGADTLIIGGPLVKPIEDFEKDILPTLGATFAELLDGYMDTIEGTLEAYYATRPAMPHLKVILVSHRDDVTQVPALPVTMYALEDTNDILVRSNPCRISLNGVHFGVCNEDVVSQMRGRMVERWPCVEGSLSRVVDCIVHSRLYTPIFELPSLHIDLKHLAQLHMDYVPPPNEVDPTAKSSHAPSNDEAPAEGENWGRLFRAIKDVEPDGDVKLEMKRVKHECTPSGKVVGAIEYFPHIMFLPSTRPQFATVSQGSSSYRFGALNAEQSRRCNEQSETGVLVVNQEIWSRRSAPKFELRVAEVTIPDYDLVIQRGASVSTGVACGVLHIFQSTN